MLAPLGALPHALVHRRWQPLLLLLTLQSRVAVSWPLPPLRHGLPVTLLWLCATSLAAFPVNVFPRNVGMPRDSLSVLFAGVAPVVLAPSFVLAAPIPVARFCATFCSKPYYCYGWS